MYSPFNKYSLELATYVFTQCACWSALEDLTWKLYFNFKNELTNEDLIKLYKQSPNIAFIFKIAGGGCFCILIAYRRSTIIADNYSLLQKCSECCDWVLIINKIANRSWDDVNFNNSFLIWDPVEQQSVGDLIDSLSGGLVANIPESWVCLERDSNWRIKLKEKYTSPSENEKLFQKWCKEVRDDNKGFDNSLDFIYWLENIKTIN